MVNDSEINVLIVGAGAVGLVYAYHLSQLKNIRIGLIARSNYEQIKTVGAEIVLNTENKPDSIKVFHPDVLIDNSVRTSDKYAKEYDYIIIAAKSQGTDAISGLNNYMGPKTLVVLAQNGIDIEQPYIEEYPGINLASSIVRVATAIEDPMLGHIVRYYSQVLKLKFGMIQADNHELALESLKTLVELNKEAGVESEITDNLKRDRWEKLLWNGTFNTLCAITNVTPNELLKNGLEDTAWKLMNEIWTLAETDTGGGDNWVPKTRIDEIMNMTQTSSFSSTSGFLPSTLQDVRKGKELEFEALTGNAVRLAHRLAVPVPTLDVIYGFIKVSNYRIQSQQQKLAKDEQGEVTSKY